MWPSRRSRTRHDAAYGAAEGPDASPGPFYLKAYGGQTFCTPPGFRYHRSLSHVTAWFGWAACLPQMLVHLACAGVTTMSDNDKRNGETPNTGVLVKARAKTRKPAMYKVLMLNDDYTPMEFVVHVLERFFQKTREEATRIMLHVHRRGVGVCGVFTYEVAETKVTQVMDLARQNQHPLQCTIEKE